MKTVAVHRRFQDIRQAILAETKAHNVNVVESSSINCLIINLKLEGFLILTFEQKDAPILENTFTSLPGSGTTRISSSGPFFLLCHLKWDSAPKTPHFPSTTLILTLSGAKNGDSGKL